MRGSRLRRVGIVRVLSRILPMFFLAALVLSRGPVAAAGSDPPRLISTYPIWMGEPGQDDAYFGYSVAPAGDVNGDGFSDLIVGAPRWDGNFVNEGAAFLYLGSPTGPATEPAWFVEGGQTNAQLGFHVAPAGDVNGDGYGDVIIGIDHYDGVGTDSGRAQVYLGGPSGLSATPVWTGEGTQAEEYYGRSIATAGDVNGDGYDDILVGAPDWDETSDMNGKAMLYLGTASGVSATPAWTVTGTEYWGELGWSVSTAGDVNADGYADVIIGAPGEGGSITERGRARVYLGSAAGLAASPVWRVYGGAAYDHFGLSVSNAGDVDGDGYCDIMVGAPDADAPGGNDNEGRVYVYRGSAAGPATTAFRTYTCGQADSRFGTALAPAGDTNGDSYADIIIGAPGYDGSLVDQGKVFLYEGSAEGPFTTPSWTHEGNAAGDQFGFSAVTAGDVNGDGFSDLVIGAPLWDYPEFLNEGSAWVYTGQAEGPSDTPAWVRSGDQATGYLGFGVACAGDINGDGFSDIAVGASRYDGAVVDGGRVWAYLGTSTGPASDPNWVGDGDQEDAHYGYRIASAGDVDGDGYGDLLVSSHMYDSGGMTGVGRVELHRGSAGGLIAAPAWTKVGDSDGMRFGQGAAGAGDVNGDGYADVIIGAPGFTGPDLWEGKAFLFLGSPSGLSQDPAWTMEGGGFGFWFGASVSAADVNGDGYSDVIIGAPQMLLASEHGHAYVYLGGPSGLASTPAWIGALESPDDSFGSCVSTAGDVDGDGFEDVIVGAPGYSFFSQNAGIVMLFRGSAAGLSASPSWMKIGDQENSYLGSAVASAGDVNGDGYSDVAFSASEYDGAAADMGRVWVKLGAAGGPAGSAEWALTGSLPGARLGETLAGAGDTNADGYDDLIIGAPYYDAGGIESAGQVVVVLGNDRSLSYPGFPIAARQQQADQTPIDLLGRSQSEDGFNLMAIARGAAGRIRLRMEWQAAGLATPLGSVALSRGPWILPAFGSQVLTSVTVTGMPAAAACHWRLRAGSRSPYFPWTPWMSTPRTVPSQKQLRTGEMTNGVGEDTSDASPLRLMGGQPNPFHGRTTITYSVAADGPVRLSLHDVTGRCLRILVDASVSAGRHTAVWDGCDAAGRRMPAGVYLARIAGGGEVITGKLLNVR